jgi:hypothetical protein
MKKIKRFILRFRMIWNILIRPDAHFVLVLLSKEQLTNLIKSENFNIKTVYYDRMQLFNYYQLVRGLNNSISDEEFQKEKDNFLRFIDKAVKEHDIKIGDDATK